MTGTVMPPTRPIIEAVEMVESGIGRFLDARHTLPKLGKYESDLESLTLFNLVIRHIEAICTLAKRDLVMLPSAMVIARGAFESTVEILWILHPEPVFDREARWLAYLAGGEEYLNRTAGLLEEFHHDGSSCKEAAKLFHEFRVGVEKRLPPTTRPLKAHPNFRRMLKDIGEEQQYLHYIQLCQFAHGTHAAGELYRKNLGSKKVTGEFIFPESWAEPLKCSWWCLATGGTTILAKLGGKPEEFLEADFLTKVTEALKKV